MKVESIERNLREETERRLKLGDDDLFKVILVAFKMFSNSEFFLLFLFYLKFLDFIHVNFLILTKVFLLKTFVHMLQHFNTMPNHSTIFTRVHNLSAAITQVLNLLEC